MKNNKFYLLIAGSRMKYITKNNKKDFFSCVDKTLAKKIKEGKEIIIVHGGCNSGGDKLADEYAKENGYKTKIFPADWTKGKSAGYIRNKEMHSYISQLKNRGVFLWWDGVSRGTSHSINLAKEFNNPLRVYNFKKYEWIKK